ncbi:MAG: alpha-glucan family phosphorylase [Phycisphaerae bacterium]|nr:alpha-glucan family phosphorylase [Phycisphaerae bacterium]
MPQTPQIAYFTMEAALDLGMPTYSGGLGVLAGDALLSAADLGVPMVGVTLVHRRGYFTQGLGARGEQIETPTEWRPSAHLEPAPAVVEVGLHGRRVVVGAWRCVVHGATGREVSVLLLDTDHADNHPEDRRITDSLYGGDERDRLRQEAVLGIGGVRMLRALGLSGIRRFHMNVGHAALLTLELARESAASRGLAATDPRVLREVRSRCVFTTHTPVPAGHDRFDPERVREALEPELLRPFEGFARASAAMDEGRLNLTRLALSLSRYVNGVSRRHAEVSRRIFAPAAVDSITNGVHAGRWTSPAMARVFDRHVPGWQQEPSLLRRAMAIPGDEVWEAHATAKRRLLDTVRQLTGETLDPAAITLGFARRAATYKRHHLLLSDPARLGAMSDRLGPVQVVFAGKSHPRDGGGKDEIRRVFEAIGALRGRVRAVFLPNYDMALGAIMTAGSDVWVNTPRAPLEASGTSGMKAALNGVPSLSVLDGWWLEGCVEGVTGWAIGTDRGVGEGDDSRDAADLFDALERRVLPTYYGDRERFVGVMRHAIGVNGAYFNTHRMVQEYVAKAYFGA